MSEFDRTDYSVVVKLRANPPVPWRWEIYRAGKSNAIMQSVVNFRSMAAVHRAGKTALTQLLDKTMALDGLVKKIKPRTHNAARLG